MDDLTYWRKRTEVAERDLAAALERERDLQHDVNKLLLAANYEASRAEALQSASAAQSLIESLRPHAEFDDGDGNEDASVLRGRLACILDILNAALASTSAGKGKE